MHVGVLQRIPRRASRTVACYTRLPHLLPIPRRVHPQAPAIGSPVWHGQASSLGAYTRQIKRDDVLHAHVSSHNLQINSGICVRVNRPVLVAAYSRIPQPLVSVSIVGRNDIISKTTRDTSMFLGDLFFHCVHVGVAWLGVAASQPWTLLVGCHNVSMLLCRNMRSGMDASQLWQVNRTHRAWFR